MIEFLRNFNQNHYIVSFIFEASLILILTIIFEVYFIGKLAKFNKKHPYLSNLTWVIFPMILALLINYFILDKSFKKAVGVFIILIILNIRDTKKTIENKK